MGNFYMLVVVCLEFFKDEFDFWEIFYKILEKCCFIWLLSYFCDKVLFKDYRKLGSCLL